MKKILPVLLLFLTLTGCQEEQKNNQPKQEIHPGFVNFAAILVLDDLITHGIKSDFISLSPVPIVNPDDTITAEAVLEDFRRDFVESQDKYPLKLAEGLSVTWKLDHNADAQYGLSFHKEDRTDKTVFAGKLSLRFDSEYYSSTSYPTYSKDSTTTIICHEFTGATERKNSYLIWIDIAFDRCMAVTDYYASVRNQLKNQLAPMKERLNNIYAGNEAVSETIANKLKTFYQAGNVFSSDSICLIGNREECLSNLKNEIIKKYEDTQMADLEHIKIRITDQMPEKKKEAHKSVTLDDTPQTDKPTDNQDIPIKEKTVPLSADRKNDLENRTVKTDSTEKKDTSVTPALSENPADKQSPQNILIVQPKKQTENLP